MNKTATAQPAKTASFLPPSHGILQRKCACGNHTIAGGECADCARKKMGLQRKLTIGASNDPLEQEADRIADQVMAMPVHDTIRRRPIQVQRVANTPSGQTTFVPASVERALSNPGQPLETGLRKEMEGQFGYDFSRVRIHTGGAAERSARDVNALAYTYGDNIVFGPGRFAPRTYGGRQLLAHELTHVVQQQWQKAYIQTYLQRGDSDFGEEDLDGELVVYAYANAIELSFKGNGVRVDVVWWYLARQRGLLTAPPPYSSEQIIPISDPQLSGADLVRRLEAWTGLELLPGSRSHLLTDPGIALAPSNEEGFYVVDLSEEQLREWFGSIRWQMFLDGELPEQSGDGVRGIEGREIMEGIAQERGELEGTEGSELEGPSTPTVQTIREMDNGFQGALSIDATDPAFPAILEGPELQSMDSIGTYRMSLNFSIVSQRLLEIAERLNPIAYHWERYDITELARQGLRETAATERLHQAISEDAAVPSTEGTWRRARQEASDVAEDTAASVTGLLHPLDSAGGDLEEVITSAHANQINLALLLPSAIVAAGGVALDAMVDMVGGYSQEREIAFSNQEGVYLIRCIATPSVRGRDSEIRRESSVATKIVEVRPITRLAEETLGASQTQIANKELELEIARHQDPPDLDQIQRLEQNLQALRRAVTGSTVDAIDYSIAQLTSEQTTATGLRWRQIDAELEDLRQQREFALEREGEISGEVYRVQGVLVSELTGQSYSLLLQLGELNETESEFVYLLSDVTTRDGKRFEGRGSTRKQAVQNAMHRMALGNDYGRGIIVFHLPAPFQPREYTERSHPGSERIARQRLEDLATVLVTLSLFVPGVGEVAAVLGAALSADRIYDRWRNGTLRMDAAAIGDMVGILGAAAQGVSAFGQLRVIRAEGRFVLALRGADEVVIQRALADLVSAGSMASGRAARATEILGVLADWGGFALGNITILTELARLYDLEVSGAISHAEASRDRARLLTSSLRDGFLQFGGGIRPHPERAQSPTSHTSSTTEGSTHPTPTPGHQHLEGTTDPHAVSETEGVRVRDFEGPTAGARGDEVAGPIAMERRLAEATRPTEVSREVAASPTEQTPTSDFTGNERIRALARTADGLHQILILDDARIVRCSRCETIRSRYEAYLREQIDNRRDDARASDATALESLLSGLEQQSDSNSRQIEDVERQLRDTQARLEATAVPLERQRLSEQEAQLNARQQQLNARRQTIADETAILDLEIRQFAAEGLASELSLGKERIANLLESFDPIELRTIRRELGQHLFAALAARGPLFMEEFISALGNIDSHAGDESGRREVILSLFTTSHQPRDGDEAEQIQTIRAERAIIDNILTYIFRPFRYVVPASGAFPEWHSLRSHLRSIRAQLNVQIRIARREWGRFENYVGDRLRLDYPTSRVLPQIHLEVTLADGSAVRIDPDYLVEVSPNRYRIIDAKYTQLGDARSARRLLSSAQSLGLPEIAAGHIITASPADQASRRLLRLRSSDDQITLDSRVEIYTNDGPVMEGEQPRIRVLQLTNTDTSD